jgi:hypothetical protein
VSFRPVDWAPLAQFDPLPGDPDAVFDEAARLRTMAAGITDQVARLRQVGAEESLIGASVTELRAAGVVLVPGLGEAMLGVELLEVAEAAETVGKVSAGINLAAHLTEVTGGEKDARFELGMDILALGSFSAATRLTRNLKQTAEATRDAAAQAAKREAEQGVRDSAEETFAKTMADPTATEADRVAALYGRNNGEKQALQAGVTAERGVAEGPEAKAGLGHVLLAGDSESANATENIAATLAEHPGDAEVQRLAAHGQRLARYGRANFWTATAVDAADKTAAHKESWKEPYGQFKHWVATGSALQ